MSIISHFSALPSISIGSTITGRSGDYDEPISKEVTAEAEARAVRHPLKLYFLNSHTEAEYAENLNEANRRAFLRLMFVPLIFGIVEMPLYFHNFRFEQTVHIVALTARGAGVLVTATCLLLTWKVKRLEKECERVALTWAFTMSVILMCCDPIRISKILGVWADLHQEILSDDGLPTFETSLLLALAICNCSTLVFVPIRSYFSWTLPGFQLLVFCLATFPGLMVRDLVSTMLHLGLFALLDILVWVGCYRHERLSRHRWSENFILRQEVKHQKLKNEQQTALLAEVTERLEALQAVTDEKATASQSTFVNAQDDQRAQVAAPKRIVPCQSKETDPNPLLTSAMAACEADRGRLKTMSRRIREADYGLGAFFQDAVHTFPELGLFHLAALSRSDAASGRSMEQEYQRTIGALFAVYWLLRTDIDGKEGFCFGVGEDFEIRRAAPDAAAKREAFFDGADWTSIQQLVSGALCFKQESTWTSIQHLVSGALCFKQERIEAMLCLTAFHDIMKVRALCPKVAKQHAPFQGYAEGETIGDHDLALAYVLEHYPDVLPSYRILSEDCRKTVLFTQSKMNFNHGWFVQSEAPPGLMLQPLRSVLSQAEGADLAFYFLHWLTDLSGAEGRPMAGAEKFVLKFPMRVLGEFMWSIPFLQKLRTETEVTVVEEYLWARWSRAFPERPLPTGQSSVALLRLAVMAQSNASRAIDRFWKLPLACQETLCLELARTGLDGQTFKGHEVTGGPSFLVYYGPALLQRCSNDNEVQAALAYLSGVLSAGRALFPLDPAAANDTVTLEISQLVQAKKNRRSTGCPKTVWALLVQNQVEAKVEAVEISKINSMNRSSERYWLIDDTCADQSQADQWQASSCMVSV